MTIVATDAAITIMNIIQIVTEITIARCVVIAFIDMTVHAIRLKVGMLKLEFSLAMIVISWKPGTFNMAVLALLPHAFFMRLVLLVAIVAAMICHAINTHLFMTSITGR